MCGIAGIFNGQTASGPAEQAVVARMLQLQQHRGPDGHGIHKDGWAVLGHSRLSIVDLTTLAAQPMSNEDGSVWVSFNGEIYNYTELREDLRGCGHTFQSASDTEVLVHGYEEWGMDRLVKRLRGMFAFALYDSRRAAESAEEPLLFLARDRMGIKPLYYAFDESTQRLIFASEVKTLVESGAVPRDVNQQALASFLCLGSVPYPQTCRSHVNCLPPGAFLAVSRRERRIRRFWELGDTHANEPIAAALSDAVRRHLMADVPVGVFLSGGVDSSAVAALAADRPAAQLFTLTISFAEAEFDEAAEARTFATRIGADHHEIPIGAGDFLSEMPKFLAAMDQPTADGVNTYFVSRAARELGLKVVLSGLGGDEVFFGYSHYRSLILKSGALGLYAHAPALLRAVAGTAASACGQMLGREQWGRFDHARQRSLNESLYLLVRGFFPPGQAADLLGMSAKEIGAAIDRAFEPLCEPGENGTADAARFQQLEMRRYLHDQLLRDSDVFSMAHSIELRVPLIDDEVVRAASAIPGDRMIGNGMNKPRLVEAVPGGLLVEAAKRPKRGFTFPFATWMKAHANELEEYALGGTLLDRHAVRNCWKRFRVGRLHWSRAWSTVVVRSLN
ncbi:MAG: asparagine synthase (glutamine-hydrolyzing) [Acidobacteriaceae bacterium]|nr:asparagine synthase (glutamine-hydrolyzing) [Acidobacteriaceae bacterium]